MRFPNYAGLMALLTLLLMIVVSAAPAGAGRDPLDWKNGKLGHLSRYIGTYQYEAIFDDPAVRQSMKDLLGENVSLLLRNIQVRAPIGFEGFGLVLLGGKPHEAHLENAILIVEPYDGEIHAGIMSKGITTIYSKALRYHHLPLALQQWVRWDEVRKLFNSEPKTNFRWVK